MESKATLYHFKCTVAAGALPDDSPIQIDAVLENSAADDHMVLTSLAPDYIASVEIPHPARLARYSYLVNGVDVSGPIVPSEEAIGSEVGEHTLAFDITNEMVQKALNADHPLPSHDDTPLAAQINGEDIQVVVASSLAIHRHLEEHDSDASSCADLTLSEICDVAATQPAAADNTQEQAAPSEPAETIDESTAEQPSESAEPTETAEPTAPAEIIEVAPRDVAAVDQDVEVSKEAQPSEPADEVDALAEAEEAAIEEAVEAADAGEA
ncbi:hypothetical protein GGI12_004027, partial [Dipsacomyces acuminosporus]